MSGAGAVAERRQHVVDAADHLRIRMAAQEIRHHAEARHERRIARPQRQRIGLERLEAACLHLGAQFLDVVERAQRLDAQVPVSK